MHSDLLHLRRRHGGVLLHAVKGVRKHRAMREIHIDNIPYILSTWLTRETEEVPWVRLAMPREKYLVVAIFIVSSFLNVCFVGQC